MVSIYVLKLEKRKYYVGLTRNDFQRLNQHKEGKGAAWTKKYPPVSILSVQSDLKPSDENKITLEMMKKYGIENVRGGDWYHIKLSPTKIKEVKSLIKKKSSNKTVTKKKKILPPKKKPSSGKRTSRGYCIRCSVSKPKSLAKPFCLDCYESWARYENPDYIEKSCHYCGKDWNSSFSKPICMSCWKKNR